jgi:hypothetical protein
MKKPPAAIVLDALWLALLVAMWWTSLDETMRQRIIERIRRASPVQVVVVEFEEVEPSPHDVTRVLDEATRITKEAPDGTG